MTITHPESWTSPRNPLSIYEVAVSSSRIAGPLEAHADGHLLALNDLEPDPLAGPKRVRGGLADPAVRTGLSAGAPPSPRRGSGVTIRTQRDDLNGLIHAQRERLLVFVLELLAQLVGGDVDLAVPDSSSTVIVCSWPT